MKCAIASKFKCYLHYKDKPSPNDMPTFVINIPLSIDDSAPIKTFTNTSQIVLDLRLSVLSSSQRDPWHQEFLNMTRAHSRLHLRSMSEFCCHAFESAKIKPYYSSSLSRLQSMYNYIGETARGLCWDARLVGRRTRIVERILNLEKFALDSHEHRIRIIELQ